MPIFTTMFEAAFRFRLTEAEKAKLTAEAKRRNASSADVLREMVDRLPEPERKPKTRRA